MSLLDVLLRRPESKIVSPKASPASPASPATVKRVTPEKISGEKFSHLTDPPWGRQPKLDLEARATEECEFVMVCPLCGEAYTRPLHPVPVWQPESFRKQVIEIRHTWFHSPGLLSPSSGEREEYWREAIEEAKADPEWAHLTDPNYWQGKERNKRR